MFDFLQFSDTYLKRVPRGSTSFLCNRVVLAAFNRRGSLGPRRSARALARQLDVPYSALLLRVGRIRYAIRYLDLAIAGGNERVFNPASGVVDIRRLPYVDCLIADGIRNWNDIRQRSLERGVELDFSMAPSLSKAIFRFRKAQSKEKRRMSREGGKKENAQTGDVVKLYIAKESENVTTRICEHTAKDASRLLGRSGALYRNYQTLLEDVKGSVDEMHGKEVK